MERELASALVLVARLTLAVVFVLSGMSKVRAPGVFARQIAQYEIVPESTTRPLALLLIAGELVVGIGLVVGWALPLWLGLSVVLLAIFAVAISVTLRRGKQIPCGCFGGDSEIVQPRSLVRIGLLLGLVALAGLLLVMQPSLDAWVSRRDVLLVGALVGFTLMAGRLILMLPDALVAMGYRRP